MNNNLFFFFIVLPFFSCSQGGNTENILQDTTKKIILENFEIIPAPTFEYRRFGESSMDTLNLATCSDFVYYPFGTIKNSIETKKSILNNFKIEERIDTSGNVFSAVQILQLNSNKLILFFADDTEGPIRSYIFKGEIYDENVKFINGIKVGMLKSDFFNKFFVLFPKDLQNKYNVIVLESCVIDIWHTYTFNNDTLSSVSFKTDTQLNVDY